METSHTPSGPNIEIKPTKTGHRQVVKDYTPCPDRPGYTVVPSASDNPSLARQANGFDPHALTPTRIADEGGNVIGWIMPNGRRVAANPNDPTSPPPVEPEPAVEDTPPAEARVERFTMPRHTSAPAITSTPMGEAVAAEPAVVNLPPLPPGHIVVSAGFASEEPKTLPVRIPHDLLPAAVQPPVVIPAEPETVINFHVPGFGAIPSRYHQVIYNRKSNLLVLIWDKRCKQSHPPKLMLTGEDQCLDLSIGDSDTTLRCKNMGFQFTLGHLDVLVLVVWDTNGMGQND